MKTKLKGNIVTPIRIIPNGELNFENGIITYVGSRKNDDNLFECLDFGENYISPGFIDLHVHGGGGSDFMDGTEEAFLKIASLHQSHGTTSLLATTLTCPDEELFNIFDVFDGIKGKNIKNCLYGLHLEGPYFAKTQKGAQDEKYIKFPTREHYGLILEKGGKYIKRWSVAPELEGAMELGRILSEKGILPSMGHSDAEYETALEAFENGYTHLTHFYSGMSTITRKGGFRHPGLIESGYMLGDLTVEIIADGCHLPPSLLRYIYTAKGADKTALVTDSLRGAGTSSRTMILGSLTSGYEVIIEDGVAKLPDRSAFAGSIATTDRLVRNMIKYASAPLTDAVKMMTYTPARIANMKNKGLLRVGFDADIAVFDDNINIKAVFISGSLVSE
ncbi:MAG: N-acetylglucosamine-6-phosphate deacetylase [Clostridiales bacterium]|jgi:N-acetylglucosamine-6-phosphate deacetylase|nr:N-acetylglucosamine-6-phosphate deacetylase [Clostridiales bacterium]